MNLHPMETECASTAAPIGSNSAAEEELKREPAQDSEAEIRLDFRAIHDQAALLPNQRSFTSQTPYALAHLRAGTIHQVGYVLMRQVQIDDHAAIIFHAKFRAHIAQRERNSFLDTLIEEIRLTFQQVPPAFNRQIERVMEVAKRNPDHALNQVSRVE
jgi:hypothetical protein